MCELSMTDGSEGSLPNHDITTTGNPLDNCMNIRDHILTVCTGMRNTKVQYTLSYPALKYLAAWLIHTGGDCSFGAFW